MTASTPPRRRRPWIAAAAALTLCLAGPPALGQAPEGAREPAPEAAPDLDGEALSAQLRRLGELIRQMGDAAARTAQDLARCAPDRAGTASIAPEVTARGKTALYGPEGPTERSVKAVLEHRLVVLGNPHLRAGRVAASGEGISAEVVTAKEGALVERFLVDRASGVWTPER